MAFFKVGRLGLFLTVCLPAVSTTRADITSTGDGDADLDQDVDGDDVLIWQRQFGMTAGGPALAAVPEPSALTLAMAIALFRAAVRCRRNQ